MARVGVSRLVAALVAAVLVAAASSPARAGWVLPDGSPEPATSRSVPFSWETPDGSWPLDEDDPRISGPRYDGVHPEQIRVLLRGPRAVAVTWATGSSAFWSGESPPAREGAELEARTSALRLGVAPHDLTVMVTGVTDEYSQLYWGFASARNYTSPVLHKAELAELEPGTTYFYRVSGAGQRVWSPVLNFTTPRDWTPVEDGAEASAASASAGAKHGAAASATSASASASASSPSSFSSSSAVRSRGRPRALGADASAPPSDAVVSMLVIADGGQTPNSSTTYARAAARGGDFGVFVGDMSYADDTKPTGELAHWLFNESDHERVTDPSSRAFPPLGTYQRRWDLWGRLVEPLLSRIPFAFNVGNHEWEADSRGRAFGSYVARLPPDHLASGSSSPLHYSLDVGPLHLVFLTPYDAHGPGSAQRRWLLADLAAVDRAKTPWVVATMHAPFYISYTAHFQEVECMRLDIEPVLYALGVDLVLTGHVHAYERARPVYDFALDECAPAYVSVGDGGNLEKLATTFVDGPGNCPAEPLAGTELRAREREAVGLPDALFGKARSRDALSREPGFEEGAAERSRGDALAAEGAEGVPAAPAARSRRASATTPLPVSTASAAVTSTFSPDALHDLFSTLPISASRVCPGRHYDGKFCPTSQPEWSVYREPAFGFGALDVLNATHAAWGWFRNLDAGAQPADDVVLVRADPRACAAKRKAVLKEVLESEKAVTM